MLPTVVFVADTLCCCCDSHYRAQMIATDERMTEDKLKEMRRLFEQMTKDDELEPEALTYSHLIYG